MNWIKKALDFRLTSKLSGKGIKVKTLLIVVLIGILIIPIFSSYENRSLKTIAVSEDGSLCAYVSDGDYIDNVLHVSKSDGTLLFKHVFSSEETAGGDSVVWFNEDQICVYTLRQDLFIVFSKDGTIESKEKIVDFDYPDYYSNFSKGFSTYFYKTEYGEYKYINVDIFNSFVFRKNRALIFVDNQGKEFFLWQGEQ